MGRVRRGAHIIFWWIGDHAPLHVHVRTNKGRRLGRVDVATFEGMENWTPPKDLIDITAKTVG